MGRLIDADELERYIDNCDFCNRCPDASPRCQIDCEMPDFLTKRWKRVIEAQPTVDAEPVRHGRWNRFGFNGYVDYVCSECGVSQNRHQVECGSMRYCPCCGAKMDGGKHETD